MTRPQLLLSWSSGKDSAWTLHRLRTENRFEIVGLATTVTQTFQRVAIHGVRDELLEAQARAARLPLWRVPLPYPCPNSEYERALRDLIERARSSGVTHMAFGDLFLADIRAYRERLLADTGVTPVFPLWRSDTAGLAREMIAGGVRAILTCVDPKRLPRQFAGRAFDEKLLGDFPPGVDACGENGEFHTFCCAGPMFEREIAVRVGEIIERDGFVYADVLAENFH